MEIDIVIDIGYIPDMQDPIAKDIGRQIKVWREVEVISQHELARRSRTQQYLISAIEGAKHMPTIPVVRRIANALGADLEIKLVAKKK